MLSEGELRTRESILLAYLAGVKENYDKCCRLAARGEDFHEEWESAQQQTVSFLSKLHEFKDHK